MNVSMAIAATLRDVDVPPGLIRAVPILARTAGLIAHCIEEAETPIGFLMASKGEEAIAHTARRGRGRLMPMVEPDIERRPGRSRRDPTRRSIASRSPICSTARASIARSSSAPASPRTARSAGSTRSKALPLTEKDELRASRTPDEPIGDASDRVARRDRAHLFDQRHDRRAELYSAHRRRSRSLGAHVGALLRGLRLKRGERIVSTYNAGPFVAGAALGAFDRLGLCHIPVGTGNTERLIAAVELLKPTVVAMTPSYALHLAEWARERGMDLAKSSVKRVMVAGEPGGGEPAMRAKLEAAWGASVTEAMGIGDISVSLWGECEQKAGMHFSGRGFVHFELIDPETGAAKPLADGAEGELVLTHLVNRSAPLLRFRTRDHVRLSMGRCACGRTARACAASGAPTTC